MVWNVIRISEPYECSKGMNISAMEEEERLFSHILIIAKYNIVSGVLALKCVLAIA